MAVPSPAETVADAGRLPAPYWVTGRRHEAADVVSLTLQPVAGPHVPVIPGQFNMLYAFAVGEVPVSISGDPSEGGTLLHTVRDVGATTHALTALRIHDRVGVRGPFGSDWGLDAARGHDLVVVAGGIGLAPLRPVIVHALRHREDFGRVVVLVGARTPADLIFADELERWGREHDVQLRVTVDLGSPGWSGDVGVVTGELARVEFDAPSAVAMICGPEVMMRFAARGLIDRGVAPERIRVSLERHMQCATGHCGHCQLGPFFACSDGPVFSWDRVGALLGIPEL